MPRGETKMAHKTLGIGVVGGTGYSGVELLRLLAQHPHCELKVITSRQEAGTPVAAMFPSLRGWFHDCGSGECSGDRD